MGNKKPKNRKKTRWWTRLVTTREQRETPRLPLPNQPDGLTQDQRDMAWAVQSLLKDEILAEHEYLRQTTFPVYSLGYRDGLVAAWGLVEQAKQELARIQKTLNQNPTQKNLTLEA